MRDYWTCRQLRVLPKLFPIGNDRQYGDKGMAIYMRRDRVWREVYSECWSPNCTLPSELVNYNG
jgi:hypothetical protein